jgi:hypothetical protein
MEQIESGGSDIHKILAEHNMTLQQLLSYDDETKLRIIENLSDLDQRKLNNAVQFIKSCDEDMQH